MKHLLLGSAIFLLPLISPAATIDRFHVDLMPLNGSGVSGSAIFTIEGNMLTVQVSAMGLEANMLHPQHIHGLTDMGMAVESNVPPSSADTDGDGFVELAEGLPFYGPVLLSLTSPPGTAPSGFPTASPSGVINFTETYDISGMNNLQPLSRRVFVMHGMTVGAVGAGTEGEVNGIAGYKATLPVAAAEIEPVPEPGTYALLSAGLGVICLVRRRVARG